MRPRVMIAAMRRRRRDGSHGLSARMRPVALHLSPAACNHEHRPSPRPHDTCRHASRSQAVTETCACCGHQQADGWQSQPLSLPEAQLRETGTLIEAHDEEATFSEYHPAARDTGPRCADRTALLSLQPLPSEECTVCTRCFLRYTEGSGYFVDRRIRALDASLLVDAPLLDD